MELKGSIKALYAQFTSVWVNTFSHDRAAVNFFNEVIFFLIKFPVSKFIRKLFFLFSFYQGELKDREMV